MPPSGDVKSLALRRERARRRREALGPGEAYRAPGETWRALEQAHIPPFSSLGRLGEAGLELREPVTARLLGLSLARRQEEQGQGLKLARRQEQGQGVARRQEEQGQGALRIKVGSNENLFGVWSLAQS